MVRRPRFQLGPWGPIIESFSTKAPGALAWSEAKTSLLIKFNWVAHAVEEVLIVRTPSRIAIGSVCSAISAPTMFSQLANRFPSAIPLCHSRSWIKFFKTSLINCGSVGFKFTSRIGLGFFI